MNINMFCEIQSINTGGIITSTGLYENFNPFYPNVQFPYPQEVLKSQIFTTFLGGVEM